MSYYLRESKFDRAKRVVRIIVNTLFKAALGFWFWFCFATSAVLGAMSKLIKTGFNLGWNLL